MPSHFDLTGRRVVVTGDPDAIEGLAQQVEDAWDGLEPTAALAMDRAQLRRPRH